MTFCHYQLTTFAGKSKQLILNLFSFPFFCGMLYDAFAFDKKSRLRLSLGHFKLHLSDRLNIQVWQLLLRTMGVSPVILAQEENCATGICKHDLWVGQTNMFILSDRHIFFSMFHVTLPLQFSFNTVIRAGNHLLIWLTWIQRFNELVCLWNKSFEI